MWFNLKKIMPIERDMQKTKYFIISVHEILEDKAVMTENRSGNEARVNDKAARGERIFGVMALVYILMQW